MKREEEIKIKALSEYRIKEKENKKGTGTYDANLPRRKAFIQGAEWADKTMIEKACEWITEHIDIPYEGEFIDDSPVASDYIEWCEKRLEYAKAIADAFKQAMEE